MPGLFAFTSRHAARFANRDAAALCYDFPMKSRDSAAKRDQTTGGVTVGRERFGKISAVEGVALSRAAKQRAAEYDRLGLAPEERIRRIVEVHRKG
jgi:hypothetical protein